MAEFSRRPLPLAGWRVRASGGEGSPKVGDRTIDAAPLAQRSIHAVLAGAGIGHPWEGERAELDGEWVGRTEWTFSVEVEVPPRDAGRRCALVIETLDGPCEIVLGGVPLGAHMSGHFPFEARVPEELRGERTRLELRFKSPVAEVLRWQSLLGARPVNGDWTPFSFARTAACGFGWDWGPRVPGVGLYGAWFECWDGARVTGVSVAQRWNDDGSVTVRVSPDGEFDPAEVACAIRDRGSALSLACDARGEATFRPARLWSTWDRDGTDGCGWSAMVRTRGAGGAMRLAATARFAPRRIALDSSEDPIGRRFRFLLNGEPLFAKGANLIPPPLGLRHEHDWLRELTRYRDTGFNMVRVWGGGNYLPDAFHDACDALGILVWQDFMFACATYPEDEPFATLVAREAAHQVRRLSRHPSTALWCGGNEDILAWASWGWKERLAEGQSWGLGYWTRTLPEAVAAHDPGTPYWTESPWSGSLERHPNDPDHGDRHTWDAEAKIEGYRTILPRFSSEFGHQSPPCWATIVESCLDPARRPEAMSAADLVEALKLRQKAWGGDDFQYRPFLDARFRPARDAREYAAQAQHLQARAMDVAMRWLRANAPRSMGALIWQWNDVWAGHSWSLVDVAGRAKPAWHAVRAACAPVLLAIEPTGGFTGGRGAREVVLVDDAALRDPGVFAARGGGSVGESIVESIVEGIVEAIVERIDFAGAVRGSCVVPLRPFAECGLPAATMRGRIPESFVADADPARECLVARVASMPTLAPAVEFLGDDAMLELETPEFEPCSGEARRWRARTVVREFWIEPDDHASSGCWRTLLPGDEIEAPGTRVWWCANRFRRAGK